MVCYSERAAYIRIDMNITNIIIYGLAIWRISSLLVNESGPAMIFLRIREWVGITHDDSGGRVIVPETFLAQSLDCVWCCSIWVAFFFTLFWSFSPVLSLKVAVIFCLSAVAIVIDLIVSKLK